MTTAVAAGIAVVLAYCLGRFWRRRPVVSEPSNTNRHSYFHSNAWANVRLILTSSLGAAFLWRSLVEGAPDAVAASFLAIVLAVEILPWVSKVVLPGNSGEIDLDVKDDARALDENAGIAELTMARAAQYLVEKQLGLWSGQSLSADPAKFALETLLETTQGLSGWLRPVLADTTPNTRPERIRVTAWVFANERKSLRFFAGWPAEAVADLRNTSLNADDPVVKDVAEHGVVRHYAFVPEDARPPAGPETWGRMQGLLVVPVRGYDGTLGILQLERESADLFRPSQVVLAKALASLYASALG